MSEKLSNPNSEKNKWELDDEKKTKWRRWIVFFSVLIGPVGLAGGYHSEISHFALWYCGDEWAGADISRTAKTEAGSGQIQPLHTLLHCHELFSFSFLCWFRIALFCICLPSLPYLLSFWLRADITSLSKHQVHICICTFHCVHVSLPRLSPYLRSDTSGGCWNNKFN